MTKVPHKRPGGRPQRTAEPVQVAVPDHDVAYLETLARVLEANDATAARLRAEIESILAEEIARMENILPTFFQASIRH
jgi:hypothetical protein